VDTLCFVSPTVASATHTLINATLMVTNDGIRLRLLSANTSHKLPVLRLYIIRRNADNMLPTHLKMTVVDSSGLNTKNVRIIVFPRHVHAQLIRSVIRYSVTAPLYC